MTTGIFLFLNIGTSEMMLIMFVALFLFGGKKLPELARGLGRGIREFKDASETIKRDINDQINSFESEINDVKSEVKSITQESSVQDESFSNPTKKASASDVGVHDYYGYDNNNPTVYSSENNDATVNGSENSINQENVVPHSDDYYKNYDYKYRSEDYNESPAVESPTSDSAPQNEVSNNVNHTELDSEKE